MRQAIRLLQLSSVELEAEVAAALESNPLLEAADTSETPLTAPPAAAPGEGTDTGSNGADASAQADGDGDTRLDFEDTPWPSNGGSHYEDDGEERHAAAPEDLHAHLVWQLQLSHLGERDLAIGLTLIDLIGDDGYLESDLAAVQVALLPEVKAEHDEIEAVLHLIQRFDPVGVGSRSLSECLLVQLGLLVADTPGLELARQLCRDQLDALARLGAERLGKQLGQPEAGMQAAVELLRSLDPRPGNQIGGREPEYIAPDAVAFRRGGRWQVALATGSQPQLAINRHYQSLIGKASRDDDHYLRGQLQEARWLIKSLETRADTLLRVARAIVRQQCGFLEHGAEAMRPLTLREVAEELGLHESTISRATSRKYLRTPRGTFEFRYFFSSGIGTDMGGAASATAISAMLRKLIEAENPRQPLSDARLAALLKAEGIPVARRTVAKYREAMNIPASTDRQRLG